MCPNRLELGPRRSADQVGRQTLPSPRPLSAAEPALPIISFGRRLECESESESALGHGRQRYTESGTPCGQMDTGRARSGADLAMRKSNEFYCVTCGFFALRRSLSLIRSFALSIHPMRARPTPTDDAHRRRPRAVMIIMMMTEGHTKLRTRHPNVVVSICDPPSNSAPPSPAGRLTYAAALVIRTRKQQSVC